MYGYSNSIQVLVNNTIVKPFPFMKNESLLLHTAECGANNYYFRNRTIHFVITGDINCLVLVRLVNTVQVNMRLLVTIA